MQRNLVILFIILALYTSTALAQGSLMPRSAILSPESTTPYLDVFGDTLKYDDGVINWWYGGLTNFRLATKFTPAAGFHLQRILLALDNSSTSPVTIYLKNDSSGYPGGAPLWSGNLFYTAPYTWMGVTVDTFNLPQYNFAAGSNFWIEMYSNGPPFEIYDAAPVNPARSMTYYAPLGGWFNSPGDNFLRVVGEYSASVVDVSCDSISLGGYFFEPSPVTLPISAVVSNHGSSPATFAVACSLFVQIGGSPYSFYSALQPHTVNSLQPGSTQAFNYGNLILTSQLRYRFRTRTLLAGDGNPDNNFQDVETQIYSPPAELRYDDSLNISAAYALTNNGWAMKFDPHQSGSYNITQIRVMVQAAAGDSAARIQMLDDNGVAGAPGTILYQSVATMANGWNSFNVNLTSQTESFYVAYLFEHGTHTSALRFDDYPASGQGWIKNGANWAADPSASDWMIRVTISAAAPPQALDVNVTPINPPINIPPNGGSFSFNLSLTRVTGPMAPYDVWTRVKNPNGTYTGNLLGPITINTPVGVTVTRHRSQNVPRSWAAGLYTFLGYVNDTFGYPASDSAAFNFTKLATGSGPVVWDATCFGEPLPGETLSLQPAALSFSCSPNPFNPSTVLSFELRVPSLVSLKVYDTTGRLVAKLVEGWQEAGGHEFTFDGSKLASGLYFVRMEAGDFRAVQKLMLIK